MIVVPPAIEAHQPVLHQFLDLRRFRVDHAHHILTLAGKFPVDEKEIWEDFDVVKHQRRIRVRNRLGNIPRLEGHLAHKLQTILGLVRASGGKGHHWREQITYIIMEIAVVGIIQRLKYKVDARLRVGEVFPVQIAFDHRPQRLFTL